MTKKSKKTAPIVQSMSSKISDALRDDIIAKYINSSAAKQNLARSMIAPLRTRLDYSSIGRKAFIVEEVLCEVCKKPTVEGANAGCPHCIARDVIES
jgi:hypothetical protein